MILRTLVLGLTVALFAAAAWLVANDVAAWPMLVMAGLLIAGTLFERVHYRGNATDVSPAAWRPTDERFLDDASGRHVTVWFNPTTGERKYEEE